MLRCIWGREGAPALDLELVSFREEIRGGTVRKGGFTLHSDKAREGFCGV